MIAAIALIAMTSATSVSKARAVGPTGEYDIRDALQADDNAEAAADEQKRRDTARRAGTPYMPMPIGDSFATHNVRKVRCVDLTTVRPAKPGIFRCSYDYAYAGPIQGDPKTWPWKRVVRKFTNTAAGWRTVND